MGCNLRWLGLGALVLSFAGCGGEADTGGGKAAGGGAGAVVGVAPADLAGGDAGRAGGQQNPGQPNPPADQPPPDGGGQPNPDGTQDQGAQSSGEELLSFLPPTLSSVVGLKMSALNGRSNAVGQRILSQMAPVTNLLSQAGIAVNQVEHLWAGSNRTTGDLLLCVKTRGKPAITSVLKGLGAGAVQEKIGAASVYPLPKHPTFKNSIAVMNPTTFLVGRHETVVAGLKNPVAGSVRWGLETLNLAQVSCWLAGDESMLDRQGQSGALAMLGRGAVSSRTIKPRGVAIALSSGAQDGGGGQDQQPQPPSDGQSPPMDQPEIPGQDLEVIVGMSFTTEAIATAGEGQMNNTLKAIAAAAEKIQQAQTAQPQDQNANNPPPDQPPADPNSPAGNMPRPSGARRVAALTAANLQSMLAVSREKEKVRLTLKVPSWGASIVLLAFNDLLQSVGSSAIGDGIFEGTLVNLSRAALLWFNPLAPSTKADTSLSAVMQNFRKLATASGSGPGMPLQGARRVGDLPLPAGYSWMTELLPHLGREDLYHQIDFSKSPDSDGRNMSVAQNVIPAFLNPQDSRSRWRGFPFSGMGLTHFVGMSGVEEGRNVIAAALDRSDPRAGIFGYDRVAKQSEITDGTANTIMILGSGRSLANPWIQGGGATIRGARAPYFDDLTGFGSVGLKKPGTFVMFADGSARVISADISPEVFKAMCTMHGAEKVDLPAQVTLSP